MISVFGRTRRVGRWQVSSDTLVIALFGTCRLDLTQAFVDEDDDELSMTVITVFGFVSVLLPQGTEVHPSGIALLASTDLALPAPCHKRALAPLSMTWTALFSRIRITEQDSADQEAGEVTGGALTTSQPSASAETADGPPIRPAEPKYALFTDEADDGLFTSSNADDGPQAMPDPGAPKMATLTQGIPLAGDTVPPHDDEPADDEHDGGPDDVGAGLSDTAVEPVADTPEVTEPTSADDPDPADSDSDIGTDDLDSDDPGTDIGTEAELEDATA